MKEYVNNHARISGNLASKSSSPRHCIPETQHFEPVDMSDIQRMRLATYTHNLPSSAAYLSNQLHRIDRIPLHIDLLMEAVVVNLSEEELS